MDLSEELTQLRELHQLVLEMDAANNATGISTLTDYVRAKDAVIAKAKEIAWTFPKNSANVNPKDRTSGPSRGGTSNFRKSSKATGERPMR
jgi:hypothetical protein